MRQYVSIAVTIDWQFTLIVKRRPHTRAKRAGEEAGPCLVYFLLFFVGFDVVSRSGCAEAPGLSDVLPW